MIKDSGFAEEAEVRLVCSPLPIPKGVEDGRAVREVEFLDKAGTLVPFVPLFHQSKRRLPIKRVIVGPSVHSGRRKESVAALLRRHSYDDVEVAVSNIPFRADFDLPES